MGSRNMSFFELAVGIVGSLFVSGIAVGFLIIEVLPGDGRRYRNGGDWREPPPRDDYDRSTRWPGD
jgi:hypothetical protein